MKYLVPLFLLISSITVYSQSLPVLRIHKTDKSITTIPLKEIDSLVHATIVPVNLVLLGVKNISNTSALCEARIISRGEGTLGQFGFCWSTTQNPTISANKVFSTSIDSINFSNTIYSLTNNTKYYARAFAYNELGICYSNQIEFSTLNIEYTALESVQIGKQIWTSKNLDVSTYLNGDSIKHAKNKNEWFDLSRNSRQGAWCYYNFDSINGIVHGKLYNLWAIKDPRKLPPNGYHIPSKEELLSLIEFLGGESNAGFMMKSTSGWNYNGNGDNSSGFNGLPSGMLNCSPTGTGFLGIGGGGYWWTSNSSDFKKGFALAISNGNISGYWIPNDSDGLSVRCLKD
jgi:uncharacterized protein (TIGR02145 family)